LKQTLELQDELTMRKGHETMRYLEFMSANKFRLESSAVDNTLDGQKINGYGSNKTETILLQVSLAK
jgi:hypothetical protein